MNCIHRLFVVSIALLSSAAAFPTQSPSKRDPTQDPRILDALGSRPAQDNAAAPVTATRQPVPSVTLKALVVAAGRDGSAIVQCGDVMYSVGAGSVFVPTSAGSTPVELRVVTVTSDEVRIAVASTGDVLVLR